MQEPELSVWVKNQRQRFLQRPCQLSDEQVGDAQGGSWFWFKKVRARVVTAHLPFLVSFLDGSGIHSNVLTVHIWPAVALVWTASFRLSSPPSQKMFIGYPDSPVCRHFLASERLGRSGTIWKSALVATCFWSLFHRPRNPLIELFFWTGSSWTRMMMMMMMMMRMRMRMSQPICMHTLLDFWEEVKPPHRFYLFQQRCQLVQQWANEHDGHLPSEACLGEPVSAEEDLDPDRLFVGAEEWHVNLLNWVNETIKTIDSRNWTQAQMQTLRKHQCFFAISAKDAYPSRFLFSVVETLPSAQAMDLTRATHTKST